ncbi:MAG: hypothetical protein ACK4PR_00200 [Gammaproteobacteria bacterium]
MFGERFHGTKALVGAAGVTLGVIGLLPGAQWLKIPALGITGLAMLMRLFDNAPKDVKNIKPATPHSYLTNPTKVKTSFFSNHGATSKNVTPTVNISPILH